MKEMCQPRECCLGLLCSYSLQETYGDVSSLKYLDIASQEHKHTRTQFEVTKQKAREGDKMDSQVSSQKIIQGLM